MPRQARESSGTGIYHVMMRGGTEGQVPVPVFSRLFLSKYGMDMIATLGKKCNKTLIDDGAVGIPEQM